MEFRTEVTIPKGKFEIEPCEEMLFVGSCFADTMGERFKENKFRAVVNPDGVMYNPVSVYHSVMRTNCSPRVAFFTLGTNHVYRLKASGEIVDNCQKRPQNLFQEEVLGIDECKKYLGMIVDELKRRREDVHIVITVSPIRYAKYGFHQSQLSKSTLLLAADGLVAEHPDCCEYFPAYEVMNDELRDYRFYSNDMLHPSDMAVDYLFEKLSDAYFSDSTRQFMEEWMPVRKALAHKPFHPDDDEYKIFMRKTMLKVEALSRKYPNFAL